MAQGGWAARGGGLSGQKGPWAEGGIGLRERSDRLAASEASRAVQDRDPWSEATVVLGVTCGTRPVSLIVDERQ